MRTIYLPRNENPYMDRMWGMVTNLAMMKAAANIRAKESEAERNYADKVRNEEGKVKMATSGYKPVREMSKEHAALAESGEAVEAYGEVWGPGAGKQPKIFNVEGQKFVTFDGNSFQRLQPDKPLTREVKKGDQIVTEQYNYKTNSWETYATAPRHKPPQTNVNVNMGDKLNVFEEEFLKKQGSGVAEAYTSRNNFAQEAINQNNQLSIVKNEIQKGARTGYGEETLLNLRSLGQTFGIETGNLAGQELIRKISNEMALRLRNPESGLGLTGNTSNKDLDFLKNSVIGLQRTEAGNLKIIEAMEKLNKFKIDLAKKQQEIVRQNGNIPPMDLEARLLDYANNYKMFSPSDIKQFKKLNQSVKATYKEKGTGRTVIELEDGTLEYAD